MNKEMLVLDYLRKMKKAMNIDEIAAFLKMDSFSLEEILDKLILDLKVKIKGNKFIATNYHTGILHIKNNKAYIDFGNNKIWISLNRCNGAANGDTVLVDIVNSNNNNFDGEVINIIEKYKKNNVGTVVFKSGKLYIKSDRENIYIDTDGLIVGSKVSYKLGDLIKDNIYTGEIIKVIGHVDDPKIDVISKLAELDIDINFSEDVLKELEEIPSYVDEDISARRDLRDKLIFTIDGDDSKDLDDAISLEVKDDLYILGVHIADVSHYIKYNSKLDEEAYKRSTSVYPPGSVIPMIPHKLSSGICSLFEGVDRLTMSCVMTYSKSGKLLSYEIFPSIINSSKRMTYSKVNCVLEGNIPYGYEAFKDTLLLMNEFKNILRNNRFNNGSIDFDIDKVKVIVDEYGVPKNVLKEKRLDAEKMIEEFMLQANICVATDLSKCGESIYRIHAEPDIDKLNEAINVLKALGVKIPSKASLRQSYVRKLLDNISNTDYKDIGSEMVLRSMARANYSKDNCGHYGLNFDKYTHFTSPIRRYPDLTVHRLLKHYHGFEDVNMPLDIKDYLNTLGVYTSLKERNADMAESIITHMKMAEYMQEDDNTYEGKIVEIEPSGLKIELYSGIVGRLVFDCNVKVSNISLKTKYKLYKLGDIIDVKVDFTNKGTGDIRFKEMIKTR